jgi:DNA-binding CsgD family transcriptional regulator
VKELDYLWPDDDLATAALARLTDRINGYPSRPNQGTTPLRPHEARLLIALSHGLTSHEAAVVLGVPVETLKSQLKVVRRKLAAKTTPHAIARALRLRLID